MKTISRTFTIADISARVYKIVDGHMNASVIHVEVPCPKCNANRIKGILKKYINDDYNIIDVTILNFFKIKCEMTIDKFIQNSNQKILKEQKS